jgi:hypothetical protein
MDETVTVPESEPGRPVSGSEVEVKVGASKPAVFAPNRDVKKVVVAVHGIGDQYSFATIQSVVNRFCVYYGLPAAVPLGRFHSGQPAYSLSAPYPDVPFKSLAFTEVYWAPIARGLVDEKHTLEEAKTWAHTIVERLRLRWRQEKEKPGWQGERREGACRDQDFQLTQQVLGEMIQTIAVVERLSFLAEKAGLFTFDLRRLLDDYLGDVQVVAEFTDQREKILKTFATLLDNVEKAYPEANIYIVAHSEGTVVAILGLLEAFRQTSQPGWTQKVRGLMTLGSPIDKHLALWPDLFGESAPSADLEKQIEWRNYYDFGDPVGFKLESIREWIETHDWQKVFHFEDNEEYDIGFTRYPFPGKAHVDYWTDQAVFDHFISEVVEADEPLAAVEPAEPPPTRRQPRPKPASLRSKQWPSYGVPYVGVFALLFVAAFILYKTVTAAMGAEPSSGTIALRSAGLAALLYGITIAARIPRLTYSKFWWVTSLALAGLGALFYMASLGDAEPDMIKGLPLQPGTIMVGLAFLVAFTGFMLSVKWPTLGLIPLISSGAITVTAFVIYHLNHLEDGLAEHVTVWPVVLATAGFLYLWWLAALLFDLVFIWHLYIRHSKLMGRINQVLGTYKERIGAGAQSAPGKRPPLETARLSGQRP